VKDTILEAGRQFTSRWRPGKDYRSLFVLSLLEHGSDKSTSSTQVASPRFHPLTAGKHKAAHNFQLFDLINNSLFNDDRLCILALFRKKEK